MSNQFYSFVLEVASFLSILSEEGFCATLSSDSRRTIALTICFDRVHPSLASLKLRIAHCGKHNEAAGLEEYCLISIVHLTT